MRLVAQILPDALRRLGQRAAQMIRDHARAGIGSDGKALAPYSRKPFARPLGGITQKAQKNLGDRLKVFTTRKGKLWAIIEGGYEAYKKAAYPQDGDGVNMTATGNTLRAVSLLEAHPDGTLIIGFTRREAAEIAYYHHEDSATIRDWLGLTPAEQAELSLLAASEIQVYAQ